MQTKTIDISQGLHSLLQRKKKTYPCHVNRISALDDPCERKLYYKRTAWDQAAPISDGLQGVFETGSTLEPVIERIVSEVGQADDPPWRIVGSQTPTNDDLLTKYKISGSIDGFLQVKDDDKWDTWGVIDIKTCSPNVYPQIHDYNSLARYPWTRKYRGQLMLYALAHNLDGCYILFVNKANLYQMKLIDFEVDMGYCDDLLAKAEHVNMAVDLGQPPDGINDPDQCPRCEFYSYCCPDISTGGNMKFCEDGELEEILERMDELSETVAEYKELAKARDSILVKGQDMACGHWLITWQKVEVNRQAQPAKTTTQWRKKVVRV